MSELQKWLDENNENRRLFAQEELILDVSESVLGAMEVHAMTKADLAKALGQSKAHVTQLLNGGRNMTLRTLSDIAYTMGLRAQVQLVAGPEGKTDEAK